MATERVEATRKILAPPAVIFTLLCEPDGHVHIDSSGMLQAAEGETVTGVGDQFVVHMDREALGDRPLGRYDVTVVITAYERNTLLEWTIEGGLLDPPLGHRYGYQLDAVVGGTMVTSYCDWSQMHPQYRDKIEFPIVPQTSLRASLGILARTING